MAGERFSASGNQNLAATAITCLTLEATAATRAWCYDMVFSNEGTPADLSSLWTVQRSTVDGVGTAVTPSVLDLDGAAAVCTCIENQTTEPTYTANQQLYEFSLNHRTTYRWVAAPGGEIILPADAGAGFGIFSLHASATTLFRATIMWTE